MKKLDFQQMEIINGGGFWSKWDISCGLYGLAAGIATGFNPIVGGITTAACLLQEPK